MFRKYDGNYDVFMEYDQILTCLGRMMTENYDVFSEYDENYVVFREYDENYAPMSLDEAYMDITDYLELNPGSNPWDVVQVGLLKPSN